jgi:uncharacterized protein
VVVGVIGIFLPLLPTVPFLLLAAYCYERGSPELHQLLLNNRYLGPHLRRWNARGAIRTRIKFLAITMLVIGVGVSVFLTPFLIIDLMLISMATCVALYIATRPAR